MPRKHHSRLRRLPGFDYSRVGVYSVTFCTHRRLPLLGEIIDGRMMHLSDAGRIVQHVWNDLPNHYRNIELDEFQVMPEHVHAMLAIIHADQKWTEWLLQADEHDQASQSQDLQLVESLEQAGQFQDLQSRVGGPGLKPSPNPDLGSRSGVMASLGQGLKPCPAAFVKSRLHSADVTTGPEAFANGRPPAALPEIVRGLKTFSARHINELLGTPGARIWQPGYHDQIVYNERILRRIRRYIMKNPMRY